MARKIISREDVFNAANDLVANDQRPTILAVHKLIGRGSFTTISNYLKQWESEHTVESSAHLDVDLPEVIASDAQVFVKRLWSIATNHADAQIQHERDALRQREGEVQEEMKQAVDMANESADRIEQLEEQATAQERAYKELEARLGEAEKNLDRSAADLARSRENGADLAKQLQAAKQEADTARTERAVVQQRLMQAEEQTSTIERKCATLEGALEAEKGKNIGLTERLQSMQEERETVKAELATVEKENRQLLQDKGMLAGQLQEKDRQARQLEDRMSAGQRRIAKLEHLVESMKQRQQALFQEDKEDDSVE